MVNRFLQGTLILTIAGFVVKAIGSLNWIFLSRVLSGEGIGIYQMAFPAYLLALQLSSAGIPIAISIMTAEKLAKHDLLGAKKVFSISFKMLFVLGLIFSILVFGSAQWLIDINFITDPRAYYSLIALAPAVFFVTLISCYRGYLQGWQMMTPTAISQIVEQLLRVVVMLGAAYILLPYGLDVAAGGASLGAGVGAVGALVVLVYYYYRLPKQLKEPMTDSTPQESSKSIIKRLINLSIPIALASMMLPIVAMLDVAIIPRRLIDIGYPLREATELYGYLSGMAVPLINLATIITAAIATSIVPAISNAVSIKDIKQVYYRTAGSMRLTFVATIPFSVMLYILAEPVVSTIYNAPRAAEATQILAWAIFFLGLHQVTTGILQGLGKPRIPVINMGIAAIVKVILNWELTALPALGIGGAAYATVADIGFAALLNLIWIHRHTGYFIDLILLGKNIVSAAIMGVGMYYFYPLLQGSIPTFFNIMITAIIGICIYVIIMILLKGLNKNDGARLPVVGRFFR